ncbi:MAG: hypothetical protein HFI12_14625 [Lachnospiraceae bacterium]|nr:hypothetical protein [Lachnospiraceae bacterium]
MFNIDRVLLKPNIPITVRFTSILYEWLNQKAKEEGLSFNLMVLLCCKYVMDEEKAGREQMKTEDSDR